MFKSVIVYTSLLEDGETLKCHRYGFVMNVDADDFKTMVEWLKRQGEDYGGGNEDNSEFVMGVPKPNTFQTERDLTNLGIFGIYLYTSRVIEYPLTVDKTKS